MQLVLSWLKVTELIHRIVRSLAYTKMITLTSSVGQNHLLEHNWSIKQNEASAQITSDFHVYSVLNYKACYT